MKALIIGGAGFVGCNYAWHLLDQEYEVIIYDNFVRGIGLHHNITWLKSNKHASKLTVIKGDVRDYPLLFKVAKDCDIIIHTAA